MEEEIFRVSKNKIRAKVIRDMEKERLDDLKSEKKTYKIVEQYFEVMKGLITALMYLDGFKTLSHKALISYMEQNYSSFFDKEEFILMDELRKLRNDSSYYGKKVSDAFLESKEEKIKAIINKLFSIADKKL